MTALLVILTTSSVLASVYMAAAARRQMQQANVVRAEIEEFRNQLIRLVRNNVGS